MILFTSLLERQVRHLQAEIAKLQDCLDKSLNLQKTLQSLGTGS